MALKKTSILDGEEIKAVNEELAVKIGLGGGLQSGRAARRCK